MAITVYGVPPNITAQKWSQLFQGALDGGAGETVTGFAPSVATGTRTVSVASGTSHVAGVRIESNAAETVTFDNVTTPRIDMVCLQVDWNGTTQSTAGTLVVVKGITMDVTNWSSLTRTPGNKWQIPIAWVNLTSGVGQLSAADVHDIRPTRRQTQMINVSLDSAATGGARVLVAERVIDYPGFDYKLRLNATLNMSRPTSGNGYGVVELYNFTTQQIANRAPDGNIGPASVTWTTGRISVPQYFARLYMRAVNFNGTMVRLGDFSDFRIELEPF